MREASRTLLERAAAFAAGPALRLFAGDVEVPVVAPTEVGVVLMCVGGAPAAAGPCRRVRGRA
ncbi:DUF5708 family protein [Streptomyces glaucus]|uniref:AraC family transcriptional regulator n=1 Tax=Streptomyces glaucus TaxID=284029 RepID=A0ABN3JSN3_9ACTN